MSPFTSTLTQVPLAQGRDTPDPVQTPGEAGNVGL